MSEELYRCPRTGRALVQHAGALLTHDGCMRYPIRRGVPDFRLVEPTDPVDEQEVSELAALAAGEGWRAALAQLRPELALQADGSQGPFFDLLPLSPRAVVLEIGSGLGQNLVELARRVHVLHALERSPGRAQFSAIRCRQQSLDNVLVAAGGDDMMLPYADRSFEVVVINHALESVRMAGEERVTLAGQQLLLREIRRVLEPDGLLFVAIRNRFGLPLLLGGRDATARNIRFGNALPRPIASALAARRPGVLGLLHSHGTLTRLLRQSGFETLRSFGGLSAAAAPVAELPRPAMRTMRALERLVPVPLLQFATPELAFIARPSAAAAS